MKNKILLFAEGLDRLATALGNSYIFSFQELGYDLEVVTLPDRINLFDKLAYRLFGEAIFQIRKTDKHLINFLRNSRLDKQGLKFIFIIKGSYLSIRSIEKLKKTFSETPIICFNPDDPWNVASCGANVLGAVKSYDLYLIWSYTLLNKLKQEGINSAYLTFGYDPRFVDVTQESIAFTGLTDVDILFIGNADKRRLKFAKEFSNELNKYNNPPNFYIIGNGWSSLEKIINVLPAVNNLEYFYLVGQAKINLNILREQNEDSLNMRTFEIPASGSFCLHETSKEYDTLFTDIRSWTFRTPSEAAIKSIELLTDNENLVVLSNYQKAEIVKHHSYLNRAKEIIKYIDSL